MTDDSFKRRQDAFFSGLLDLVRGTRVALATSKSLGEWGEMMMVDVERIGRDDYLRDDERIMWHRGGDYTDPDQSPEARFTRVETIRALIASLTDAEWEQVRPRMCRGCLGRLGEGEKCYCMADD